MNVPFFFTMTLRAQGHRRQGDQRQWCFRIREGMFSYVGGEGNRYAPSFNHHLFKFEKRIVIFSIPINDNANRRGTRSCNCIQPFNCICLDPPKVNRRTDDKQFILRCLKFRFLFSGLVISICSIELTFTPRAISSIIFLVVPVGEKYTSFNDSISIASIL